MKNHLFIVCLFFNSLTIAQSSDDLTPDEKVFNTLINYIPQHFEIDSAYKPEFYYLETDLNTIGNLSFFSQVKNDINLSSHDKNWIDYRIDQLATALYLDGKRILIRSVGGYGGCGDKMTDHIKLNNIEITVLKFCHGCTDSYRNENFISIFNNRMYKLMKIEPPNSNTNYFYGEFKNHTSHKITLNKDRTFKYWEIVNDETTVVEGLWWNKHDTLILNTNTNNISHTVTPSSFNSIYILKKNKLVGLGKKKIKLKKTINK